MQSAPILKPDLLLAKSFEPGKWKGSYSLVGHTADVVNAVSTLVDVLGERLITQFGLQCSLAELKATVRLAAYIHDWGKANHHFQGVVRAKIKDAHPKRFLPHEPQLIRHEVASILLAWEFREWLEKGEGDFLVALAAAGGHHLKLGGKKGKCTDELGEIRLGSEDDKLFLYLAKNNNGKSQFNPAFRQLLKYGIEKLGLSEELPSELKEKIRQPNFSVWSLKDIKNKRREVRDFLTEKWQPDPVLLAVVKSLLIAGDAIGSAIPNQTQEDKDKITIAGYIQTEVGRTLNEDKLQQVVDARLDGKELRPFQIRLAETKTRVTLARAGCGTGKTLGAYNWAKSQALGRKLIFCYPTTGTSTEGFLDYVHDTGNLRFAPIIWLLILQFDCMAGLLLLPELLGIDAVLLHSRANVDLAMATTGEENEAGEGSNEGAVKLESFKAWGRESIVCTVDTVLGWLQCNRRPIYCFPAIAQAAFVFDEVHCYDEALFGALLRFLETVKAPILLMSASFLPWQKKAIEQAVGEPIELISGDRKLEALPRYKFHYQEYPDWNRVERELAKGGKVLWVCNQVKTAIAVYKEAKSKGLNAVPYHSRYRYEDRVQHHRAVVDGFKRDEPILASDPQLLSEAKSLRDAGASHRSPTGRDGEAESFRARERASLAIATQVAEMSLDLSATLLVSQIADPAGLIQRLGRLNRRYCDRALDALFYPDPNVGFPYKKKQLKDGLRLIQSLTGEISQRDLAQWLENLNEVGEPETDSVLLDGKWRTYPTSLRKAGFNVTVLLQQDIETIKSLPAKEIPRYTVPIPAKNHEKWDRHKFYPVAPTDVWSYTSELGAEKIDKLKEEEIL